MSISSFVRRLFTSQTLPDNITPEEWAEEIEKLSLERFAIQSAIGLISSVVAMAEYKFEQDGRPVRKEDWYRWNVSPNPNQNKQQFFYDLIFKMIADGKALIVTTKKGMFVADSFSYERVGFSEDIFYNVEKEGKVLKQTFKASDVQYLTFENEKAQQYIKEVLGQYTTLLSFATKKYKKNNADRGILKLNAAPTGNRNADNEQEENLSSKLSKFLSSEKSSILPLRKGYEYEELGKYHQSMSSEDIKRLTDEVFLRCCEAFRIPKSLLLMEGDTTATKEVKSQFLLLAIKPFIEQIKSECRRKELGRKAYEQYGIAFRVDTTQCAFFDVFDMTAEIEKVLGSGIFSVDDIRDKLGEETLKQPWSQAHFMSLNYGPAENAGKEEAKHAE